MRKNGADWNFAAMFPRQILDPSPHEINAAVVVSEDEPYNGARPGGIALEHEPLPSSREATAAASLLI